MALRGGRFDLRSNLFRIPDNISVALGLRWDFVGDDPVDLDASCVAFDEGGNCLEAVFFNNLTAEDEYMLHSGDNTTGEDTGEDDETIFFHMNKIPAHVTYLMVCVTSYTGADFTLVEKAMCRIQNLATKEVVGEFSLGIVGRHNATLLCAFSRSGQAAGKGGTSTWWDMREVNIPTTGYTFVDVLPKMLDLLAVPEDQRGMCLEMLPDYPLTKVDDAADMVLSQLHMGLGWDGENDLDASLLLVDDEGNYIDHVHAKFGKLKSKDGAVLHSGDKLNGYDVVGHDDEYIEVDLNKVDKRATQIFFIGFLYDGFAKTLDSVQRGFYRLMNKSSPLDLQWKQVDRCNLSTFDVTAVVFGCVHRKDMAHWEYQSHMEKCEGRDWIDVFPLVRMLASFSEKRDKWQEWKEIGVNQFAVEVTFIQARDLAPLEPQHFACHCEAWVCDRKGKNRIKTRTVNDREYVEWNDSAVFRVSMLDRVRVMLYEHAMIGHIDLDFSKMQNVASGDVLEKWFPLEGHRISGELRLRVKQVPLEKLIAEEESKTSEGGDSWCVMC